MNFMDLNIAGILFFAAKTVKYPSTRVAQT
jgi:hypothetical protein